MMLKRNVGLAGIRYRGGGPMLSWVLHRISGLGMIIFVSIHVLAGFSMQQFGSDIGTTINTIYESPYFQIFIYFCVIFHVLNGLRIILLDLFPKFLQYQREVTWLQWLIFIPIYGLAIFLMLRSVLASG
jgi:succinate dehydrogenase / fumarate reductase cytochrome b subunit